MLREAKIEPPIQTEYLRSGGATILTLTLDGARAPKFFLHAVSNAREHGRPPGQNDVAEELAADVDIASGDGVVPIYCSYICKYSHRLCE